MTRICSFACLVVLTLCMTDTGHAQQLDSVIGSSGISTFGTITEVTREHVKIRTRNGDKVFPANEIQKVTYGEDPAELRRARDFINRGQIESARSELAKISTDGITRAEVLQDIEFYKAFCAGKLALSEGGDKIAAVKALRQFQENPKNQNSYHYYDAVQLLGDLAVALGRNDAAAKYYGLLLEKAPWADYRMRAAVLLARSLLANGQVKEALAKFEAVLAMPGDDALSRKQKLLARVGKTKCLAELGRTKEAIAIVEEIIAREDPKSNPQVFARAYNALGTCYLKANMPKDALLAYLHVDLLFFQDPDAHAEALYHLSKLWRTVNRSERALQAHSLLQKRYGGTVWASKP